MTESKPPRTSLRFQILVCEGPSCGVTHESEVLRDLLRAKVAADPDLKARVHVVDYNCFGRCSEGPNMFVRTLKPGERGDVEPSFDGFDGQRGFYPGVDAAKCDRILAEHCGAGAAVESLVDDY
jgi:(2Fe-2S) ferredoxin